MSTSAAHTGAEHRLSVASHRDLRFRCRIEADLRADLEVQDIAKGHHDVVEYGVETNIGPSQFARYMLLPDRVAAVRLALALHKQEYTDWVARCIRKHKPHLANPA